MKAIIAMKEYEMKTALIAGSPAVMQSIETSLKQISSGQAISLAQL